MQSEDEVEIWLTLFQAVRQDCMALEFLMAADDDDFPLSYLFYIIGVIAVMAFLIIGGFFLWVR